MKKAKATGMTLVTGLLLTLGLTAAKGDSEQVVTIRSIVNTNSAFGTGGTFATGKFEVIDVNGKPIFLSPLLNKLLFTQNTPVPGPIVSLPILAPDGHQVTLQEWVRGFGEADIKCVGEGTKYKMRFQGLIPNGVYTVWHFTNLGNGALATHPSGENNNTFQASPDGDAMFSAVATPGPMTFAGAMPQCGLTDLQREFFVVLYHIDSLSCGGFPCGGGTDLPHLYFAK